MRIGIDARMYGSNFTGIGRYNFELIRHLATFDAHNEYVIFLRKEAFNDFIVPNERFTKVLADYSHYSFGEQFGFLILLRRSKLDLMHFTHFNAPVFYRKPFVVTIHDLTLSFYPGKKMTRFFHRWAYQWVIRSVTRHAKRIISVSNHTKKDLMEVLGLSGDKVEVIHNGVSEQFRGIKATPLENLKQAFDLQRPYFLYTGVWRNHKNVVGMIEAFADFNREADQQYDLVITGRRDPAYPEVLETIKSLGIESRVRSVGLVSEADLMALYRHALAYVFPSFYEGFGLPPLEAMACGTPVIASNASAIPEVCGEANALYFNPESLTDMADKMKEIAMNEALRERLIARGFERVKAFDWRAVAKRVLKVYNGCA